MSSATPLSDKKAVPDVAVPPPGHPTASTPANAQTKPDDPGAQRELDCMWQQDYQGFEYAKALAHLPKVLSNPDASPEQRSAALVIAAASYFVLGDRQSAKNCFRTLVQERLGFGLRTTLFPDALLQIYEEALRTNP